MNNPQREKRAYIAYLSELIQKQYTMKATEVEGTPIEQEITQVESHLKDLDIVIERQKCECET
jgi:hypothetical protein